MYWLVSATLLNLFISFNIWVCVESLEFSAYKIISSAKRWLYFFLSNLDDFYFFSCLIALSRTSSALLNKSGQSRHPYLVLDLWGKAFNFWTLSMMFDMGSSHMASIRLNSLLPSLLNVFYYERMLNFFPFFLLLRWSFFILLMWCIKVTDFHMLNQPYIPGMNPTCHGL